MSPIVSDSRAGWRGGRIKDMIREVRNGVWGEDPREDRYDVACVRAADFDRQRLRVKVENLPARHVERTILKTQRLARGDVILEKSGGGDRQPVGAAVLFDQDIEAVCSNFCARLRPADDIEPRFLNYSLAAAYYLGLSERCIKQTTGIQNLDGDQFFATRWAYPPLPEQRRIADFLDVETARIDEAVRLRSRQRELVNVRTDGALSALFGPTSEARPMRLKHLLREKPRYGVLVPEYVDDGVPFIRINDLPHLAKRANDLATIPAELSRQYSRTVVRTGDVLMSVVGTLGRAVVAPPNLVGANVNRAIACIRVRRGINPHLLVAWASTSNFIDQAFLATGSDSAQRTLGMEDLANFRIDWPATDAAQRVAADQASRIISLGENLSGALQRQSLLLVEQRQALIAAAATGQFDVTTPRGVDLS